MHTSCASVAFHVVQFEIKDGLMSVQEWLDIVNYSTRVTVPES